MVKLILIRGPAGAGKSTIAKLLQKKMGKKTALIEMDNIYYNVLQNDINHEMVLQSVISMADIFLKNGYNVILEGVFTVPFDKQEKKLKHNLLFNLAKKHNTLLNIFFLNISLDIAIQRDKARHGFKRLRKNYISTLHEKTCARRHNSDIEITTDNFSPLEIVNKIMKLI
jgi:adenylylsulfate kinase-like enzyme